MGARTHAPTVPPHGWCPVFRQARPRDRGASGIGRATVLRLAAEGADVVAADVNAELLSAVAVDAHPGGGRITPLVGDVASETGAARLVAESVEALGGLDVVVNAAGVLSFSHTHEQSLEEWNRLLTINLTGTFLVCRQAIPHLLATGGNIVNIASTTAHAGQAWAAAYAASKGGVLAMTRALAVEYAKAGLRVNSISPGAIDTPIVTAFQLARGRRCVTGAAGHAYGAVRLPGRGRRRHRLCGLRRGVAHERRRPADRRGHPGLALPPRRRAECSAQRRAAARLPPVSRELEAADRRPGHQLLVGPLVAGVGDAPFAVDASRSGRCRKQHPAR